MQSVYLITTRIIFQYPSLMPVPLSSERRDDNYLRALYAFSLGRILNLTFKKFAIVLRTRYVLWWSFYIVRI